VAEAIANPRRRIRRLVYLIDGGPTVHAVVAAAKNRDDAPVLEAVSRDSLDRVLPLGAVHQGLAAEVAPLPPVVLADLIARAPARAVLLVLDQVTDPHNVGAVLRSAAAFGALAVVVPERNAPPETGVLVKAASGALEHVPLVRVTNLARALTDLKQGGFWCVGLAADSMQALAESDLSGRIAFVLGSEGAGMRRLTRDGCDSVARLPTSGPIAQLNVSNAAAVALYEAARQRTPSSNE